MIDGRLLVPAAGTWVGAAGCLVWLDNRDSLTQQHEQAITVLATAALAAAAVGALAPLLARKRVRPLLLAIGGVLVGALAAATWTVRTTPPPMTSWVDARATADVVAEVTGEPQVRTARSTVAWGDASWTQVRVRAETVSARGTVLEGRIPMTVRLPLGAVTPAPGSRVHVVGRLAATGGAGGVQALLRAGPSGLQLLEGPGPLDRLAHRMRVGLREALDGTAPAAGALVAGLALGDESRQPPGLADDMRASGLSHLTAVSGGNVAIVLGLALAVSALMRLRLWARALVAGAALGFFVLLVGGQPSVMRAAVMGGAGMVALVVGGRRAGPSVLSVAVIALVIWEPWLALAWGFALSVLATAGLVLMAPVLRDRVARLWIARRWPAALLDAVALTVAAQAATLPVLVAMGAAVGWVSVPANLAAMPAVPPVTVLGLTAAALSVVLPSIAAASAHLAAWPAGWIAVVASAAAQMPGARLPWPSGWLGVAVVAGVGAAGWLARWGWVRLHGPDLPSSWQRTIAGALVLAVGFVTLVPPARRDWPPAGWFMIMCDVGQGDGLLLRSGDGRAVVVDTGPDPVLMDGCLSDAGIDAVDAVVLTHFHADHVRGLAGVLHDRSVGAVMATPVREPIEEARAVEAVLTEHRLMAEPVTAGDERQVGDVRWRVIWPRRRIDAGSVPNNASVVLVAAVRDRTVLLAADVEPQAQAAMAADLRGLDLDVVKVPHHGSANQSPELPTWAGAPVALISVGADNDYGHPAAEVVAAWEATGAIVARTDEDGSVAVVATAAGTGVVTRRDMLRPS